MAWPKLRNKSSRSVTVGNRSGAAHDGARAQGSAEGTPGGQGRGLDVPAGTSEPVGTDGPAAWPGTGGPSTSGAAEVRPAETGPGRAPGGGAPAGSAPAKRAFLRAMPAKPRPAEAEPPEVVPVEVVQPETVAAEAELTEAEPDSADLPLWDWSPPGERSGQEEPAAAAPAEPPTPEWKPVVTPVEETAGGDRKSVV